MRKSPITVATPEAAMDAALDGIRTRPIVAIDGEGNLVVCCRTTARKHGWEVQGKLYARARSGKNGGNIQVSVPVAPVVAKAPKRRAADKAGAITLSADALSRSLADILGTAAK